MKKLSLIALAFTCILALIYLTPADSPQSSDTPPTQNTVTHSTSSVSHSKSFTSSSNSFTHPAKIQELLDSNGLQGNYTDNSSLKNFEAPWRKNHPEAKVLEQRTKVKALNQKNLQITQETLLEAPIKYRHIKAKESFKYNTDTEELSFMTYTEASAQHVIIELKEGQGLETLHPNFATLEAKELAANTYLLTLEDLHLDAVEIASNELIKDASVNFSEPDFIVQKVGLPQTSDTFASSMWGLDKLDIPEAWSSNPALPARIVAVIDTGTDYWHPDLDENILIDSESVIVGHDYYSDDTDPMDEEYHGTHVSGTVAAEIDNGEGVPGTTYNVKIMPLRFLGPNGGYTSDAIRCINYAIGESSDNNTGFVAHVLSNSWGGGGFSKSLERAIKKANSKNIPFVAAAGNNASNNDQFNTYPANYRVSNVISVAATDSADQLATFSNYGSSKVHVAAPGVAILSTIPRPYQSSIGTMYYELDGTSMATPHVSAVAAMLLAKFPSLTPAQLRSHLIATSDTLPQLQNFTASNGRINAQTALNTTPSTTDTDSGGGGNGNGRGKKNR